jgi:hypothetical protein
MQSTQKRMTHSTQTSNLADILERVLDKGIVIAGDIKVKLVDIELLTIQIRLLVASVDKAKEMGMDWWIRNPDLTSQQGREQPNELKQLNEINELKQRIAMLEQQSAPVGVP